MTQLVTREIIVRTRAQEVPFLARLVQQFPRAGTDTGIESYLAVLDSVLEDRRVTATEVDSLRDLDERFFMSSVVVGNQRAFDGFAGSPVVPDAGGHGQQPLGDPGVQTPGVRPPWRSRSSWPLSR
jgi:hypothetical protein